MTEIETWLPVRNYDGIYSVSSLGRVRSEPHVVMRSNGHPQTVSARIRRTYTGHGYEQLRLCRDGNNPLHFVHVMVCEAFHGPRPEGMEVRHLDGDSRNNRADNLAWGTQSENMYDRVRHGTHHQAIKTHCPRHHPLDGLNLAPSELAQGRRACRACNAGRSAVRYAARSGRVLDLKTVSDRKFAQFMAGADR
ncbi:NUMOD4 motif-containing HNH endonuclease [Amycolatopsis sp. CFH S0078]|uniref:NUMOD4 motif-containing HNH endonuclease n=1 Tax=Amycolatopsis sp. CFH S0078 TaxID=1644108 RepID=UPI0014316EBA|nr:NUMOD4 motif-containing HNH endonuclease [Amycolatopsis sp. CFH S0078]